MLRKTIVGLALVATLLVGSVGSASAHWRGGHGCHHGYGPVYRGYGYGYGPRVVVPPRPVYAAPPVVGYGYGVQPGYGPGYGYAQQGFGIMTPGFGLYVR